MMYGGRLSFSVMRCLPSGVRLYVPSFRLRGGTNLISVSGYAESCFATSSSDCAGRCAAGSFIHRGFLMIKRESRAVAFAFGAMTFAEFSAACTCSDKQCG